MQLILFVLNDPDMLDDIITAWEDMGVGGITILPSIGMAKIRDKSTWRDDLPLIPSLDDFHDYVEAFHRTLFTVVESDEMVDKVIEATEKVTGDLNNPNTGILVSLPVNRYRGIFRNPQ